MKLKVILPILIVLLLILAFSYFLFSKNSSNKTLVTVARVIDGDTFELANGKKVRLLGVDAPEKNKYFYQEAKEKLREMVENKNVFLEADKINSDSSGRLLRYVFVGDTFVNLEMIKQGFASVYVVSSNQKYSSQLLEAEEYARKNKLGIWGKFSKFSDCIKVKEFHFDAKGDDSKNLNDEYFILKNDCNFSINLMNWNVKDRSFNSFFLPDFLLEEKQQVKICSGLGNNTKNEIFLKNKYAVWNNDEDTLYLKDKDGNFVLIYSYHA
ncbi:MAG: thermonuclease family protein [Candidatus Aenigmatarchaeota archaeon]